MALKLPSPYWQFIKLLALLAWTCLLSMALFTFYIHLLFPITRKSLDDPYTKMYMMIGYAIIGMLSILSATLFLNVSTAFRKNEAKRFMSFFLLPFISIVVYLIISLIMDGTSGLSAFYSIASPVFSWLLCQTIVFFIYSMLLKD